MFKLSRICRYDKMYQYDGNIPDDDRYFNDIRE